VLEELAEASEPPQLILEHRNLSKLKSTDTDKLPEQINEKTGRVPRGYRQAVAATGRSSSPGTEPADVNPHHLQRAWRIRPGVRSRRRVARRLAAATAGRVELRISGGACWALDGLLAASGEREGHRARRRRPRYSGAPLEQVSAGQRRSGDHVRPGVPAGVERVRPRRSRLGVPAAEPRRNTSTGIRARRSPA
jgi:DNA polymerase-1